MGLTKQYLRFVPGAVLGVIGNSTGNILITTLGNPSCDIIAVGACENVILWNCRHGQKEFELHGEKHAVTTLTQDCNMNHIAVGYFDGVIRVFDLTTRNCDVTFSGHRTSVSCLAYDAEGFRLASGGMDTEIVVWDVTDQAGLCRLKGHNGSVTQCKFLKQKNVLVSCSKDCLVKFWALDTQHCFKTVVGNNTEIWDMLVVRDSRILAASKESGIDVYDISDPCDYLLTTPLTKKQKLDGDMEADIDEVSSLISCSDYGQIPKESRKAFFAIDGRERLFGYHTCRKTLHLFKILNSDEIKKRIQRARKKLKKQCIAEGGNAEETEIDVPLSIDFEIQALKPVSFPHNIVSFACRVDRSDMARLVILYKNNSISLYDLNIADKNSESTELTSISHFGHRSDVRSLAFSSDGLTFLSASDESVKIWNQDSYNCICSLACEFALCCMFTSTNQHCVVGTRTGKIKIFDIGSRALQEDIDAHNGSVQCICAYPNQCGFVTGGSDKNVKFWDLELVKDESYSSTRKKLTIAHHRTLKLPEEVLCVKFSPNKKMLAVSLLDSTVKVLFADTLKLAFLLYGHKLPVRTMDISYDSTLIVTGSDDRNVKIWSMEFGSCNKSIFAHEDSVTCVKFLPKTHLFFTAGKDKKLKQWDADNFQKIITLEGHQGPVVALAASSDGITVISASNDRSIRTWEKTNEPLVLEEEQEIEREAEMDEAMIQDAEPVIPGEYNKDTSLASKKTVEVTKGVDKLLEAIDVYRDETHKLLEYETQCKLSEKNIPPPPLHPLFAAFSAESPKHYMLEILRRIKMNDLEKALLLLPFSFAAQLLEILAELIEEKHAIELCCRCVVFLLRIHYGQLTSSRPFHPLLCRLKNGMNRECSEIKDMAGFVLVSLKFMEMNVEEEMPLFTDVTKRRSKKKRVLPILKSI